MTEQLSYSVILGFKLLYDSAHLSIEYNVEEYSDTISMLHLQLLERMTFLERKDSVLKQHNIVEKVLQRVIFLLLWTILLLLLFSQFCFLGNLKKMVSFFFFSFTWEWSSIENTQFLTEQKSLISCHVHYKHKYS